jgi:mannonate dehydratase
MKDNRRNFIRKSVGFAAALSAGNGGGRGGADRDHDGGAAGERKVTPMTNRIQTAYVRDAGMQMSEAYFDGFNQHKIALCRQMDVLGAVAGINPKMVGLDVRPWEIGTRRSPIL